jgi:amidohydrolase family protein
MVHALPVPWGVSPRASDCWPAGWLRHNSTAVSDQAHVRVPWPIFASDCPFDLEGGPMFIRAGIRSVEDLKLSDEDNQKIYCGNALRLLRLPLP